MLVGTGMWQELKMEDVVAAFDGGIVPLINTDVRPTCTCGAFDDTVNIMYCGSRVEVKDPSVKCDANFYRCLTVGLISAKSFILSERHNIGQGGECTSRR